MAINQVGDGAAEGVQFPNTKLGFYGQAPVALRATTSLHVTSNIAVSSSFGATQLAVVQEIMNTLSAYGLWQG